MLLGVHLLEVCLSVIPQLHKAVTQGQSCGLRSTAAIKRHELPTQTTSTGQQYMPCSCHSYSVGYQDAGHTVQSRLTISGMQNFKPPGTW
jgi:hypothetical protein